MSRERTQKIGRGYSRDLEACQFQPMIDSWDLHLRAEKKSTKTIRTYIEAAQWFAAEYLISAGFTDWDGVKAKQVQEWIITLLGRYSDSYANNQFRALQQFFKWRATEDPDEPRPNPMIGSDRRRSVTSLFRSSLTRNWLRCWTPARAAGSRTVATTRSSRCSRTPVPDCPSWPGS
jgi:hypothetical protein